MTTPLVLSVCPVGSPLAWHGLYKKDYDLAVPESMSHPAKMAWDLAFKILAHLQEIGLLQPGATVLDPMGGTGRTAIAACALGFKAVTVELEPRFVDMQRANLAYASKRLCLPGMELPWTILQGDARHLSELLAERGMVSVVSPPYQTGIGVGQSLNPLPTKAHTVRGRGFTSRGPSYAEECGSTPGQIGNLPDVTITSPPYANSGGKAGGKQGKGKYSGLDLSQGLNRLKDDYETGEAPGQIASLPDTVTLTSPPYGDALGDWKNKDAAYPGQFYGEGFTNIGNLPESLEGKTKADWWRRKALKQCSETYLHAMAQVYAEIAKVSPVLVVVVKDPTRAGKLRLLGEDTVRLMEAAGYRILCRHRSILFEEQEQGHLFDGSVKKYRGRIGFFRRLSLKRGAPAASFEHVIIGVREGSGLATITSPPYAEAQQGSGLATGMKHLDGHSLKGSGYFQEEAGSSPGQIGRLKDK